MGRVINLLNSPIIGKKSSFAFVSLLTGLGISSDRLKVRPFLCGDIDGYVAPDKRDRNLERCRVTHDSSKLETQMERKHGFQLDPSVKHVKADIVVCSITKGHDKKGVKSDVSYQIPLLIEQIRNITNSFNSSTGNTDNKITQNIFK